MPSPSYTLQARYVFPADGPPIAGGTVTVAGGMLTHVGSRDGAAIDGGNVAIIPGLVNAHTHLEFSGLSQPLGRAGNTLPQWIDALIRYREGRGESQSEAIADGLQQSLAHGVTTVGDICTTRSPADYAIAATPSVTAFHEVISLDPDKTDEVVQQLAARLARFKGVAAGVSPHAPYTVHPALVSRLAEFAGSTCAPIAMHLAESREELELLAAGTGPFHDLLADRGVWRPENFVGGQRPLDYLKRLAGAPRCLLIHGNYLDQDEIDFIGTQDRMSVVYCPRTHAYFEHAPYPLNALLRANVRVALGTDSRASNPDLDLFAEMKTVSREGLADPESVLQMGTINGAVAMGMGDTVGTLTAGKRADFAIARLPEHAGEPFELLFDDRSRVMKTYVAGVPLAEASAT